MISQKPLSVVDESRETPRQKEIIPHPYHTPFMRVSHNTASEVIYAHMFDLPNTKRFSAAWISERLLGRSNIRLQPVRMGLPTKSSAAQRAPLRHYKAERDICHAARVTIGWPKRWNCPYFMSIEDARQATEIVEWNDLRDRRRHSRLLIVAKPFVLRVRAPRNTRRP